MCRHERTRGRKIVHHGHTGHERADRRGKRILTRNELRGPLCSCGQVDARVGHRGVGVGHHKARAPRVFVSQPADRVDSVSHGVDCCSLRERTERCGDSILGAVIDLDERGDGPTYGLHASGE